MKTETNIYLRSLVEKQRADLLKERSCIINRISGSTMSEDEIEDAAFNLSEIGQKIRDFDDALTALRSEESQKQLPALSEKAIKVIRFLLGFCVDIGKEDLNMSKTVPPILSDHWGEQLVIRQKQSRIDAAASVLSEFNAAYPKKPKSK